jgi:hypothetical protein
MNTAIFDTPNFFAPLQGSLQGLLRWLMPASAIAQGRTPAFSQALARVQPEGVPVSSVLRNNRFKLQSPRTRTAHPVRKPLRIVRVVEAGNSPALVGRMVMSGRMGDVCDELDRLRAQTSTRH